MNEMKPMQNCGNSMCGLPAVPSQEDFRRVSDTLGFALPASYIEFCQIGGLLETRLKQRVLSPDEILRTRSEVPGNLVPFADGGCGDLFCWPVEGGAEPAVIFYDQETEHFSEAAPSFSEWLSMNRL